MFALGFNILGNLNKPATSIEKLGLPLWRVVIAGGILTSIMGFFNVVAVSPLLLPVIRTFTNVFLDLRLLRQQAWYHRPTSSQRRRSNSQLVCVWHRHKGFQSLKWLHSPLRVSSPQLQRGRGTRTAKITFPPSLWTTSPTKELLDLEASPERPRAIPEVGITQLSCRT